MKNFPSVIILTLLTVGMVQSIKAQQTFDSKKKGKASVNTSSLGALKINGASRRNIGGRAGIQSKMLKKNLSFPIAPQKDPGKVFYSPETGLPSFITSTRDRSSARSSVIRDVTEATTTYLDELKPILQLKKIKTEFVVRNVKTDRYNKTHVRLNQQYKGLPVYGAEVIVHLNEFNEGEAFNGNYIKLTDDIDPVPMVSKQSAVDRVSAHLKRRAFYHELSLLEKKLVQYEKPEATLCIYQDKGLVKTNVLAYHVVSCPALTERWEYFVDATTGAILHFFESTCSVDGPKIATGNDLNGISRTVDTYQQGTTYYMLDISRPMYISGTSVLPDEPIGGILTIDMNNTFGDNQVVKHVTSTNNTWATTTQVKALSAHFNASVAYEYFRINHARNSIDGEGGTIISIVNVPDEDDGSGLDNAYWNGKAMFYGNGATSFKPLAGAIDVAGHEMTHGVVQSTANLEYQGESGAINESIADIFGSMMDPADWLIGEDVVKPGAFPGGALRSMQDPHNGGTSLSSPGFQPRHKNEAYNGLEDNGGVHINSGIPNHAFYKYAEAITREKAADVFYKALDDYLTKSSKFIDLRLAVIKAAGDLFGTSSNEVAQAGLAFDFVGITNGQGGDYEENLPDNPGAEYFLIYNTDGSDDSNTLYRVKVDGDDNFRNNEVLPLTTSTFNSRPSVTDKGDAAVFVASDNTIHVINTSPEEDPEENILQDQKIWSNVVISKGGTKIAAVTKDQDAKIYVYDFETKEWGEFELYNPTYTEGVTSAGPIYADALEFDYSGEFLVYDCFNRITNEDGADIEYWDVNFIHVWDNETSDFADGTIEKLFPSLPDGVSIGNPSFAKESPYIIAFDYVDEGTNEYAILGCNIETNDVNVIVENETLGFPSYNKNDTRIAYTAMLDDQSDFQTNYINLATDKMTSSGSAVPMYENSKWPVYFATGEREIGDDVITSIPEEVSGEFTCYPNPFTREVTIHFHEPMIAESRVEVINSLGQRVFEYNIQSAGASPVVINLEALKAGYYVMKVSNSNRVGSCRLVKY
jgi:bacillolysin